MVYIVCFFSSMFFLWIGTQKYIGVKMNGKYWDNTKYVGISVVIGIFIPILLATFRETSVGSDVEFYVVPYFEQAIETNGFEKYVSLLGGKGQDLAYCLLNYAITRITSNIGWLFLSVQLITICFVFAACWQLRDVAAPWLSMLFFYFIFYNITLSTVRQSCAVALSFYAIALSLKNGFNKKTIIQSIAVVVCAITFHLTAIVVVPLLVLGYLIYTKKLNVLATSMSIILFCLMVGIFLEPFMTIISSIVSAISTKYSKPFFLNSNGAGVGGYTSVILLGMIVTIIQFMLLKRTQSDNSKRINKVLFVFDVMYVVGMLFLSKIAFIPRLLYYIQIMWNISLAQVGTVVGGRKGNKIVAEVFALLIVMIYWMYFFVMGGVHGTYPYILR